jgi:hypothetical protein
MFLLLSQDHIFYGSLYADLFHESYAFDKLHEEIDETLNRLTRDNAKILKQYASNGEAERLFDGLYSTILYASRAATTNVIDAIFYGNMMEIDLKRKELRVRYFSGPYNDRIITRSFPTESGVGSEGVATIAFLTKKIQVENSMKDGQLLLKDEGRLNAMVSIPIPGTSQTIPSRQIVLLNIDSGLPNSFPKTEELQSSGCKDRFEKLASLISRTNALYGQIVENTERDS